MDKTVYVVHGVDTEGPLYESLDATFERIRSLFGVDLEATSDNLRKLQQEKKDLGGAEEKIAKVVSPRLVNYIDDYGKLKEMLHRIGSTSFRNKMPDSFGGGWIYNWHCVDHVGYDVNPRKKDIGYHNIFDFYREFIRDTDAPDEIHWHFHPTHHRRISHLNVNTWLRDSKIFEIIARRIIERNWFPSVNRAGFHIERPDSHWFLEQWIPFDISNQSFGGEEVQTDMQDGRFGDWRRAPHDWSVYRPSHDDYQVPGQCRRYIARCLNAGTRMNNINENEVRKAFDHARKNGSTIMGFTNHDFREMSTDVDQVRELLAKVAPDYPDVKFRYSEVREAFNRVLFDEYVEPDEDLFDAGFRKADASENLVLDVKANRPLFGPQPFLAIETRDGRFHHDNFDVSEPDRHWTYTFDEHTFPPDTLKRVGVGSNDRRGFFFTKVFTLHEVQTV